MMLNNLCVSDETGTGLEKQDRPTRIGVVITSYNHADYLAYAIESVISQGQHITDFFVIDDGSDSNNISRVRETCEKYNVTLFEKANRGVASSRNVGLTKVESDYVIFLDDDDELLSGYMDYVSKSVDLSKYDAVCFSSTTNRSSSAVEDSLTSRIVSSTHLVYCPSSSPGACIFNVESLRTVGGFQETLSGADDFDILCRLAMCGRLLISNTVVLYHRLHVSNLSRNHYFMADQIAKSISLNYSDASFDTLIRLSYWYGDYGPKVTLKTVIRLVVTSRQSRKVMVRFLLAYILGRTLMRVQ